MKSEKVFQFTIYWTWFAVQIWSKNLYLLYFWYFWKYFVEIIFILVTIKNLNLLLFNVCLYVCINPCLNLTCVFFFLRNVLWVFWEMLKYCTQSRIYIQHPYCNGDVYENTIFQKKFKFPQISWSPYQLICKDWWLLIKCWDFQEFKRKKKVP